MNKSIKKVIGILGLSLLMYSTAFTQILGGKEKKLKNRFSAKQIMKDLDMNEDDKISLKEVKGPLKKDFKKIDINKDGFISKKELKATPKLERK